MRHATPILCTNFTRSHSVLLSWLVSAPTGNSFQIEGDSNLNIINTKEGNHKGPQQHLSRKKKRYPRRGPGISASWNARTCLNRTATLQIARNGDGTWLYLAPPQASGPLKISRPASWSPKGTHTFQQDTELQETNSLACRRMLARANMALIGHLPSMIRKGPGC